MKPLVTTGVFALVCLSQVLSQNLGCDSNPCENNGECFEDLKVSHAFACVCPLPYAGIRCNLPHPTISCGNQSIEITIDKRIVTEQNLEDDPSKVHFWESRGCIAVDRDGFYHLRVDAPFTDCGLQIQRGDPDGYYFTQKIVWNIVSTTVERPTVLLDFQCNYTDRYSVLTGPLVPTVTTVDFETSYGKFTVQFDLYKNDDFAPESKHSTRPVIAIDQQVCVQNSLVNVDPEHLVLTLLRCWASTNQDGTGDTYDLISNKCSSDNDTNVILNGEASEARFCFQMFKWKENMNNIYLQCFVNVCNLTAFPEFCSCQQTAREKRSLVEMTIEQQQRDSTRITSELIRVVDQKDLESWDDFLGEDQGEVFQDPESNDPRSRKNSGSNTGVLIAVGVVLVVAVVVLGVVVGVYVNFQRTNGKTLPRSRSSQDGKIGRHTRLPRA